MDIAKYIGQFLLKNQYCYIHGLGNLELKKRPAYTSGKQLEAAQYEVVVTQSGSIDDSFANFIATNEQISISKAANTLRDFSNQARKDLAEGKEVEIAHIGKYVQEGNKIRFITDDKFSFKPAGIPLLENSRRIEEQKANPLPNIPMYPAPKKADSINWTMVTLVVVMLLILGGGGFGAYYYFVLQKKERVATTMPVKDTIKKVVVAPVVDTMHIHDSLMAAKAHDDSVAANVGIPYKFVIGEYASEAKAQKRLTQLLTGKNAAAVQKVDTNLFLMVTTVNCKAIDTTHFKDSLMIFFGYKKVRIIP